MRTLKLVETDRPRNLPLRRAGRLALAICVCVCGAWMGVAAAHPFVQALKLRRGNDELERSLHLARLKNQRLAVRVKALDTPEGVRAEARKLGWVEANEQRLFIPPE